MSRRPPRARAAVSFWVVAAVFTAVMLGTTLPTPLYPAYEQRFAFGALTVTVVFATYAVGVLTALVVLGRASDTLGRKPVLAGAASVHTGGLTMLLAGRFLSGLSAGIFTGTATAAITDFGGGKPVRASLVAALANIGGLGLGPLVAALLSKHVAGPLRTPYLVHLGLLALSAAALAATPEPVEVRHGARFELARLGVPRELRARFLQAGTAGFAGFAVLGFFTAVSPAALGRFGYHDPVDTGLVVFVVFAASALGQAASIRASLRLALLGGTATLVVGIALVGAGIGIISLPTLVAGGIAAGAGQGLSFRAALGSMTAASPPGQRGAISSSFFAVCYVGISLPVIGVGAAIDGYGIVRAGEVFAAAVAVLALAALASLVRSDLPD